MLKKLYWTLEMDPLILKGTIMDKVANDPSPVLTRPFVFSVLAPHLGSTKLRMLRRNGKHRA